MTHIPAIPPADIVMLIPNLGMGGAQRVFADHSRMLAERYRVVDVAFDRAEGEGFASGNPQLTLDVAGGGRAIDKALNLQRRVAALRRIKRETGARLCISHMPGADYVNLLSRGTERTIAVVHGSKQGDRRVSGLSGFFQNRLLQPWLYRRADRVVTVSRGIADELAAFGVARKRLRTINNFFDQAAIRSAAAVPLAAEEEALFTGAPVLVTSGRLNPQKNQMALLEVLAGLKRQRPVGLVILGDGELRDALVQRAEALGLATWAAWRDPQLTPGLDLYLLGAKRNPFQWLARSNLFVFPSSWEGFPLALCEAMIVGLPVVSTDCPTGPREIIAPSSSPPVRPLQTLEAAANGLLMPMLDKGDGQVAATQSWIATLSGLLDNPATRQRLAAAGRQRMEDFTRDRIAAQWFELVDDVLAGPRSSDL